MQFTATLITAFLAIAQVIAAPAPAPAADKSALVGLKVGAVMSEANLKAALGWKTTHTSNNPHVASGNAISKRDSYICSGISGHCGAGNYQVLQQLENNLRNIDICSVGPGPGFCVLTQYGGNTGIWFCNDNTHSVSIHCWSVALMAQQGVQACGGNSYSQTFSAERFNVIVAAHSC